MLQMCHLRTASPGWLLRGRPRALPLLWAPVVLQNAHDVGLGREARNAEAEEADRQMRISNMQMWREK